jgi:hypothetical protein
LFYDLDLTVLQVPGLRRREAPAGVLAGLVAVTSPAVVLPPVEVLSVQHAPSHPHGALTPS